MHLNKQSKSKQLLTSLTSSATIQQAALSLTIQALTVASKASLRVSKRLLKRRKLLKMAEKRRRLLRKRQSQR